MVAILCSWPRQLFSFTFWKVYSDCGYDNLLGEHNVFKLHVISLHFSQREEKHILSAFPYVTFIMLMYNMSAWKELIKFYYYYLSKLAFCNNNQDLTQNLKVRGCPLVTIERMDDEFTKMLQGCDCHSTEYVAR